ncbi:MAG: tetratricopeptide repeat protein [Pseudomonadota bacterium]|nr:tetratricopeptide repeat protein [Pseudomonadota bacterium]
MPPLRALTVRLLSSLALAALLAGGPALADGDSDRLEHALLARLEQDGQAGAYAWLRSIEQDHPDNPVFYDWLSRFAMEQGDYRDAIPALERLIALLPNHMGARLDLVIALQLEGRGHEARDRLIELNGLLDGNDDLPPQARRQLAELNKLLVESSQLTVKRAFSSLLSAGIGYDSNANRGAERDAITVRLPGGIPFELPLTKDSLKTADEFAELSAYVEYGERGNGCRFESCRLWLAGATTRQYASLDEYDQRHLYLGTRKSYGGRHQREYTLMVQNVRTSELDFDRIDEQNILGLEYRQRLPGLPHLAGSVKGEVIDETYGNESTSVMSTLGINGVVGFGGNPTFNHVNRKLLWEITASWHDRPDYNAGDTQRLRLSTTYPFALFENWQGSLAASYRWREDGDAFSPSFFGSTRREDNEWLLGVQLQRPLGKQWLLSSRANYEQVDSSIQLFDVNRFQVTLSLVYQMQ